MSAIPQTPIGVDDDFEWINEQIRALKELGAKDQVEPGESYDFSIRWGTALAGRLRRLMLYSSEGILSETDEARFQSLREELRGLSVLIDRFELAHPVFTEPTPATAKRHRGPRRTSSRRGPRLRRG